MVQLRGSTPSGKRTVNISKMHRRYDHWFCWEGGGISIRAGQQKAEPVEYALLAQLVRAYYFINSSIKGANYAQYH